MTKRAASAYEQVEITSRAELRRWLQKHHGTSRGAWVVAFKKKVPRKHVDAVAISEEALCFGWIDSLPRALDDERSMLLISPRKPKSNWSKVNKDRIARLEAAGLMTDAGLAVVAAAKKSGTWTALDQVEQGVLPDDLRARFAREPKALANFEAFPPSARRGILEWIGAAKRAETRAARIEETVTLAAQNVRALQWPKRTT